MLDSTSNFSDYLQIVAVAASVRVRRVVTLILTVSSILLFTLWTWRLDSWNTQISVRCTKALEVIQKPDFISWVANMEEGSDSAEMWQIFCAMRLAQALTVGDLEEKYPENRTFEEQRAYVVKIWRLHQEVDVSTKSGEKLKPFSSKLQQIRDYQKRLGNSTFPSFYLPFLRTPIDARDMAVFGGWSVASLLFLLLVSTYSKYRAISDTFGKILRGHKSQWLDSYEMLAATQVMTFTPTRIDKLSCFLGTATLALKSLFVLGLPLYTLFRIRQEDSRYTLFWSHLSGAAVQANESAIQITGIISCFLAVGVVSIELFVLKVWLREARKILVPRTMEMEKRSPANAEAQLNQGLVYMETLAAQAEQARKSEAAPASPLSDAEIEGGSTEQARKSEATPASPLSDAEIEDRIKRVKENLQDINHEKNGKNAPGKGERPDAG